MTVMSSPKETKCSPSETKAWCPCHHRRSGPYARIATSVSNRCKHAVKLTTRLAPGQKEGGLTMTGKWMAKLSFTRSTPSLSLLRCLSASSAHAELETEVKYCRRCSPDAASATHIEQGIWRESYVQIASLKLDSAVRSPIRACHRSIGFGEDVEPVGSST